MRRLIVLAFIAVGASGCFPRPTVVQPELRIAVYDQSGAPVADARVLFIAASNPHRQLHHQLDLRTDLNGEVALPKNRELQWITVLLPHGVPSFYWSWCVEKPGYSPVVKEIYRSSRKERQQLITLEASGAFETCDYEEGYVYVIAGGA